LPSSCTSDHRQATNVAVTVAPNERVPIVSADFGERRCKPNLDHGPTHSMTIRSVLKHAAHRVHHRVRPSDHRIAFGRNPNVHASEVCAMATHELLEDGTIDLQRLR